DDKRDAVADATLGDMLPQPHQEHRAGSKGDHRGKPEHQSRFQHQAALRFERDGNAHALEQSEPQSAVPRVLSDLAPPGFAFLLERFQRGRNHRHQLHDDRGGDVRHDAEREDREARERPARKHVEHIEDATLLRAEQLGELVGIDPGHRYVRADAIDDERTQQEQQATFQVAHLRKSQQRFGSSQRYSALGLLSATFLSLPGRRCAFSPSGAAGGGSSMLPPAASIAVRAPLETSKPFTATLRLISPARITLALPDDGGTTPAALSAARSMVSAPSLSRSDRRTSAVSFRRETNPCFGSRRCSGICPPSKPTLWYPPARDFWPLWPRPAVLPWQPNPRPTRFLLLLEPGAGLISL